MKFKFLLMGLVISLGIGAYPLLATFMAVADITYTRVPAITLRFTIVVLAIVALLHNRAFLKLYNTRFMLALAVFWTAYLLRILMDGFIAVNMSQLYDPLEVLVMAFTFVLLPMMPAFVGLNDKSNRIAYVSLFVLTGITVALLMVQSIDIILSFREMNGVRFSVEKLDPISVGYVGATMVLLCVAAVFRPRKSLSLMSLCIYGAGAGCGLFVLMIAASKGPVASLLIAMLFYWLVPMRANRLMFGGVMLAGLAAIVYRMHNYILRKFDFDVSVRFVQAVEGEAENSVDSRVHSFEGAWQQFMESPLFGDAMFVKSTGGYPHNSVLEALMTTGIIGSLAYLCCIGFMLIAAIRLLNRESGYEWLALLSIFFLAAAQFSGAHFSLGAHWLTLAAVVITDYSSRDSHALDGLASSDAYQENHGRRRRRRRRRVMVRPSV